MKNPILLISLLFLSTACVVTPPTHLPVDTTIDVHGSIEPRVQFGSRSQVSIWLHPQYNLPDAYLIAENHCQRYGLWADPYNDWAFNTRRPRVLNYHCIGRRPRVLYPHIRRGHRYRRQPVVVAPPRRREIAPAPRRPWVRPQRPIIKEPRRVITPEVRRPRRPTFGRVPEMGKPWEHNIGKDPKPRRPNVDTRREVGKPWEHNQRKDRYKNSRNEKRGFTNTSKDRGAAPKPSRRRNTLSL